MITVPTTCPFCGCGCGFYLLADNGRLRGVAPSDNHPVSRGRICARGWCAHEAPLWGTRLTQPLVNTSVTEAGANRGATSADGTRTTATWDSAFDCVAKCIRNLIRAEKPIGVLGSARATNEENYLAAKLARAGFNTNNVDFSYYSTCRPLLEGFEDVAGDCTPSLTLQDVESNETILLIEGDLAETHPQAASAVMRALEKHARLITIGCRTTQMARLSSAHFSTMPGSEGEVINALMACVVRMQQHDRRRLSMAAERYDSSPRRLEAFPATDELRQAAKWIAEARRAAYLVPPMSGAAEQVRKDAAALATLAAVAGHLNTPGSGLLPLLARSNVRGACDMGATPDRWPGFEPLANGTVRHRLQRLWGVNLSADRGMDAETLIERVSGLIVVADDPATSLTDGRRAIAALRNVEFLVVLDAFATPTAQMAHVTLPIASYAETDGTVTNMEGRVQKLRIAAEPPGEARAGWEVLAEMCARFGGSAQYRSGADVLREIAEVVPRYAKVYERALGEGWSETMVERSERAMPEFRLPTGAIRPSEGPYVLTRGPAFDWTGDALVAFSPTLSRDSRSERKLYPGGVVEICHQDADTLGIQAGRKVKLTSAHGDVVIPVRLRTGLKPGVLMVPYAFRDSVASVLGTESATRVKVETA
jgi:predicted molibdopterin-dependent oxidoreductase YjgC